MTPPQPVRIQLSRRSGWRKPDNTVVVARPTVWGNPFPIGKLGREAAVRRSPLGSITRTAGLVNRLAMIA